ncbi:MAG: hypothetical protein AB1689_16435 [Thermodesulfobacteriota bacterium]
MPEGGRESLLSDAASVPVAPCPRCEREVLAYLVAGEEGGERYACVHCDGPLRGAYLVQESELDALGYAVEDPLRAGCGTGCAAGGCGVRRPGA